MVRATTEKNHEKPLAGYETVFITRNEMADDALKTLRERLTALVGTFGGEMVEAEDWGKRRLAYPIEKESRGQYTYLVYTGKGGVVAEVERNLRIQEHVLRYLSVCLSDEFDKDQFRSDRALKAKQAAEPEENSDYEDGSVSSSGTGSGGTVVIGTGSST